MAIGLWFLGILSIVAAAQSPVSPASSGRGVRGSSQSLTISQVVIDAPSFNPSRAGKSVLSYTLSRDARVTVKVFDADRELVRMLAQSQLARAGNNKATWDGRDSDGKVVPNEAYFFTIEATDSTATTVIWDPLTFSGGEFADVTQGQLDRDRGTLTYKLSQPSRVLLRAGMATGLLLKTIVDWEPRTAGTITEYWDGKDDDALFDIPSVKGTTMVLTYMTLPENSVITFGNSATTYRAYKTALKARRPAKEDRPMANNRRISPHFTKSRVIDRGFRVKIIFPDFDKPGTSGTVPTIKDSAIFRIAVADEDRDVLAGQQFELMMHVNTQFLLEEERGYLPFTSQLEVKAFPPGEHIFTINIITFGDQIGVGSRRIRVVK